MQRCVVFARMIRQGRGIYMRLNHTETYNRTTAAHRIEQVWRVCVPQQHDVLAQADEAGTRGCILSLQPVRGVSTRGNPLYGGLAAHQTQDQSHLIWGRAGRNMRSGSANLPKAFTHHEPWQNTSLLDMEMSLEKRGIVPGKGCAEAEAAVRPLLQILGRCFRRQVVKHVPQLR